VTKLEKWISLVIFWLSLFGFSYANAESFSDMLDAYIPKNSGVCGQSEFPLNSGQFKQDYQTHGVCFPMTSFIRGDFLEYHMYAVVELTNPEKLAEYIAQRKASKEILKEARLRKNFEAYKVNIANSENDVLTLTDGTQGTTPLSIDVYHYQQAILFRDRKQWFICIGGNTYRYHLISNSDLLRLTSQEKSVEELRNNILCE